MPPSRPDRKRQARLSFTPLPSSSPARAAQPPSTRDRVAAVTIEGSPNPAKRRKFDSLQGLPTPTQSSQNHESFLGRKSRRASSPATRTRSATKKAAIPAARPQTQPSRRPELELFDDSETDPLADEDDESEASTSLFNKKKPIQINDSDEEEGVPIRKKRLQRKRTPSVASSDERSSRDDAQETDDSDDLPMKSGHKKRQDSSASPSPHRSRQEIEDLDEDLDFLGTTSVDSPRTLRGPASSPHKLARQKALAAIKRRRSMHVAGANDEDAEQDEQEEYSDDGVDDVTAPTMFESDNYDEDFIDDDNAVAGEKVELPFQFSNHRTMKLKELFKYVVECMVQKKINPAFGMDDEVYHNAFLRVGDFVKGLGGSKFHSSAWTAGFSKSLNSRPVLEAHTFDNEGQLHDRCDACNRSGHPATWEVRFKGRPYEKKTLEDFSDDEDAEDDIPSSDTTYYIGRFCMRNARTAHTLAHWKYDLNTWVVDYLQDEGYCSPAKILDRDEWSTRKRQKYANKVVDNMESAGEIKRLYRDFKTQIEDAHNAEDEAAQYIAR